MKILITGRKRLAKAQVGGVPPTCAIGYIVDPNDSTKCIEDPNYQLSTVSLNPTKSMVEGASNAGPNDPYESSQLGRGETHVKFNSYGLPLDPKTKNPLANNFMLDDKGNPVLKNKDTDPLCPPGSYNPATGKCMDKKSNTLNKIGRGARNLSFGIDTAIAGFGLLSNMRENKEAEAENARIARQRNTTPVDYTENRGQWNPLTGEMANNLQTPVNQGMMTNNFYPQQMMGAYGGELPGILPTNMPAMSMSEMMPMSPAPVRAAPPSTSYNEGVPNYLGADSPETKKAPTETNTNIPHWDHNNPGNIHISPFAQKYGATAGRTDTGGRVAIFPDMETGLKAQEDLLFGPTYKNLTISQARKRWVGSDNPSVKAIVNEMGGDRKLSDLSETERKQLVSEFIKWEDRNVYNGLKQRGLVMANGGSINSNNMKIVITGMPKKNMAYGGQSGYGFDLGQRNTYSAMAQDTYESPSKTIQPVPRDQANIEAEKGETVYGDLNKDGQNEHMVIGGKRHTQGGTPLNVPEGSFIFSDTKKMKIKDAEVLKFFGVSPKAGGVTPAEIAKKYDVNKYRAILEDPYADPIKKRTAQRMIDNCENKLGYLALIQESMKGFPQGIPEVAEHLMQGKQGQEGQNPGGPEPNGVQEYPEGQEPQQQGSQEEMMEGPQEQGPEEEGMEEMPMQMYGGNYAYGGSYGYGGGAYIPEEYGQMAYGGNMPTYQTGGSKRRFDQAAGIKVTKNAQGTLVEFPDGDSNFIFTNGRVKRTSSNGTVKMDNITDDDVVGVQKTPKGGYEVTFNGGKKQVYYSNDRVMVAMPDGTQYMASLNPETNEATFDEDQTSASTNTAPSPTTGSARQTAATPGDDNQIVPWKGDRVQNKANASKFTKDEWKAKLKEAGYTGPLTNEAVQKWLYTQPQSKAVIDQLHQQHGMPIKGMFDKILGYRWDDALNALGKTPPEDTPPEVKFKPEGDIAPPKEEEQVQAQPGTKWFCSATGVMPMAANMAPEGKGVTYYNSKEKAEAACGKKPEITHPGEFVPGKDNVPTGWLMPDRVNLLAGLMNRANIKKYVPNYSKINATTPNVALNDWLARAQARQSTYNKTADLIGTMAPGNTGQAVLSGMQGNVGEGVGQDIAGVNTENVGIYNQNQKEKANIMNQTGIYNAGVNNQNMEARIEGSRDVDTKMNQSNNALAQLYDTGWNNSAKNYNLGATSPYSYIDPRTGRMVFKSDEARGAFMNNVLHGQMAGADGSQERKYALYQKYLADGNKPELAYKMAFGNTGGSDGYTASTTYADPSKNKQVTKTPAEPSKYGGKVKNPYINKR